MKSVRLSQPLEDKLRRAADAAHVSESDFIRQAISQRADEVLGVSVYDLVIDLVVPGGGRRGSSTVTNTEIAEGIAAAAARNRREIKPRS